jgi:hypothetical protein
MNHSNQPGDIEPGHIEEELLDRYATGSLSADAVPPVEEHLLICAACQSRLREADQFIHLFSLASSQIEFRAVPWWKKALHFRLEPLLVGLAMVVLAVPVIRVWNRAANEPESEVLMQSLRGPGEGAHVTAGKPARLVFDVPSTSGVCKLRILDLNGGVIQETRTTAAGTRPAASVNLLAPGDYWARLYCEGNDDLTAEYKLNAN